MAGHVFKYDWFTYNVPFLKKYLEPLRGTPCRV